ncbi:MAG: APC family permease [Pseudomonas sp.]
MPDPAESLLEVGGQPRRQLGAVHATVLALGMMLSIDTLKTSSLVAQAVGHWHFYPMWVLGGLLSVLGALCYAEMAAAFPHPGGDYHFLRRAYGLRVAALFAWSRFSIMHTGWIALMAFMLVDYLQSLVPLSPLAYRTCAVAVIVALTLFNRSNLRLGLVTQAGLTLLVVAGFVSILAAAAVLVARHQALPVVIPVTAGAMPGAASTAMIYIFLAYGGWNDIATLSAELRDPRRGMVIATLAAIGLLVGIYLLTNVALVAGLGIDGLAHSRSPAAELLMKAFGTPGAWVIVAIVCIAAISGINSTLIVGARTTYAVAAELPLPGRLGRWQDDGRGPAAAMLAEGGMAMLLVWFGSYSGDGFSAMIDYMTPVFWGFLTLSTLAVLILRRRYPQVPRPVRAPLHPLCPLLFLPVALYMLVSSLRELGAAAWYGVAVLALGAVLVELLLRLRPATAARVES